MMVFSMMKVVYMVIMVGAIVFIVAHILLFSKQHDKYISAVYLMGENNVNIIGGSHNIIIGENPVRKKSFRKFDETQVNKEEEDDKENIGLGQKKSFRIHKEVNDFKILHEYDRFNDNISKENNLNPNSLNEKKVKKSFREHGESNVIRMIHVHELDGKAGQDLPLMKQEHGNRLLNDQKDKQPLEMVHTEENKKTLQSANSKGYVGEIQLEENLYMPDNSTTVSEKNQTLSGLVKPCSKRGARLVGRLLFDTLIPSKNDLLKLSVNYGGPVRKGGWWKPRTCLARVKVAIIIPYRNRDKQLKIFLRHMHPFLQRQQLYYRIIVVEQLKDTPFNRAGLFNIGFVEALKIAPFNCFIFSDVDLLPEDDRNYYGCPTSPRHMSVSVDTFNYELPYATIFGGVGAFTKSDFEQVNGMSNLFWGWGGEDDDLYKRITEEGFQLSRPSLSVGRYTMIKAQHFVSSHRGANRETLQFNSKDRMYVDGLNTLKYHLREVIEEPLVTFVKIEMRKEDYW